jgi:general nucleoside transport system permease protein
MAIMLDKPRTTIFRWAAGILLRVLEVISVPLLAILAAFAVGALILFVTGYDVVRAYQALWFGIFGSTVNIGEAFLRATPLIFIGTGIAIAFRCGMWNIGAEGQFHAGAAAGTFVGINVAGWSPWLAIPAACIAGFLAGGMWGGIAGWLKVRFGLSEVVTTIMLNYIAIGLVGFLITGPMQETIRANPQSDLIAQSALLPRIWHPTRVHFGIVIAIFTAALATLVLFRTPIGYALRAVGYNATAAKHAGINVPFQMFFAMLLSGGLAGLAGAVQMLGVTGRLLDHISPGYGFEGIAVSLLVGNHPLGTILSGLLFGALGSGSQVMQLSAKVPAVLTFIIQGVVIAFIVSFRFLEKSRQVE